MANVRTSTAVVALSSLVLLYGCGASDVSSPAPDEFLGYALALQVPDSIDATQAIDAFISGFAGHGCDHLDRIESEIVGHKWILRPVAHRVTGLCTRQLVYFERTVALAPPDTGRAYIEVQSSGPALLDSTYVRP